MNDDCLGLGEESLGSVNVRRQGELKVILQFDSPCSLNPLKLSTVLHDAVGTVSVKPLRDGSLINLTSVDHLFNIC